MSRISRIEDSLKYFEKYLVKPLQNEIREIKSRLSRCEMANTLHPNSNFSEFVMDKPDSDSPKTATEIITGQTMPCHPCGSDDIMGGGSWDGRSEFTCFECEPKADAPPFLHAEESNCACDARCYHCWETSIRSGRAEYNRFLKALVEHAERKR